MKRYPQFVILKPALVLLMWGCVGAAMAVLLVPTVERIRDADRAFDRHGMRDIALLGGLACLVAIVVMAIVFRRLQSVAFGASVAISGVVVSLGIMRLFEIELTLPLGVAMVFVIALGGRFAIFVGDSYKAQVVEELRGGHEIRDRRFVMSEALRGIRGAVILLGVTAAVGFVSMLWSPIPGLDHIGLFLCVATAVVLVASLSLVPAITALWPFDVAPATRERGIGVSSVAVRRPMAFVLVAGVIAVVSVIGWLRLHTSDEVTRAAVQGLAISGVLAWLVMAAVLRSVKLAALAFVPTVLPIGMYYGVLGFIGHPLDPLAVMIGPIALGLAAGDTAYMFKTWLGYRQRPELDAAAAATATMRSVGPRVVMSSLVLALGFGVMLLSPERAVVEMGIMLAATVVTSLVASLSLTPALLRITTPAIKQPKPSEMEGFRPLDKTKIAPERREFAQYSDDEIQLMAVYDFFALAGKTIIRQGGRYGTRRLLYELGLERGTKVLEFGAGLGGNAFTLVQDYAVHVTGVDISTYMVETSQQRAQAMGISDLCKFIHTDGERLPFEDNTFDVVLAEAVVMYTNAQQVIAEMFRVLKPGGKIGFHDWSWRIKPNKELEQLTCLVACGCNIGDVQFFQKKDWENHLKRPGFELVYSQEQPFNFFSWHGMVDDEGTWNLLKMFGRVFKRGAAIKKMMSIMGFLNRYEGNFGYVIMVGTKPVTATRSAADSRVPQASPAAHDGVAE